MYFIVPDWAFWTFAISVWVIFLSMFVFQPIIWPKIDNYFAKRRAIRHMRNRLKQDLTLTRNVYDVNSTHSNNIYRPKSKKVNKRVTARHRR